MDISPDNIVLIDTLTTVPLKFKDYMWEVWQNTLMVELTVSPAVIMAYYQYDYWFDGNIRIKHPTDNFSFKFLLKNPIESSGP